jgi:hypothetical protein
MQQLNTAPNDLLASALHLADLGISVIPLWWPNGAICACPSGAECNSPAKHPLAKLTPNGLKDATSEANVIKGWWAKYPQANIGLVTGGEIDVIDVDGAIPAYQSLIEDMGAPEHVATVLTGRGDGGLHIYCTPGGNKTIPSGKHGLPNKIEVKGAGGYVVAPPSRHITGGTYTYLTEITGTIHGKIPLTQWLAELDTEPAPVVPIRPTMPMPTITATADNVTKYRDAVIESARSCVLNAGEGGRWMGLATEAVPKIARGIAGGLIEHHVGVYALETAARESGLSSNEVARIPELVDIMLAQGIKQPIMPPQDTEWAVNSWLGQLPKDQAGDLPADYVEIVELTPYERAVRAKFAEMRVVDDAKQMLATMKAGQAPPLEGRSLTEFLAEVEDVEEYRVQDLWPSQGRVLLAAQAKSGKTTMVAANLIPALVDGGDFLGRYAVEKVARRVVYLNMEVGTRTMRRWLQDAGIINTTAITVANLRGKASALSLNSEAGRKQFGHWLASHNAEVVILDPLAPVLASLGLDENSNADVATFFAWWSEALMLGGVVDDLVVHHAGHAGERSRGASRLLDEPDAVWTLTKDAESKQAQADDPLADTSPTRYLSAFGRDVELTAEALKFDMATRRLELTGLSRSAAGKDDFQRTAKTIMSDLKIRTKEDLSKLISGNRKKVCDSIQELVDDGTFYPVKKIGNGWLLQYIPEVGVDPKDLVTNHAVNS